MPHRVDNRPRVILEAQDNGIPVVASDYPGLVESVGAGGTIVPDVDAAAPWVTAIGALWDDPDAYAATAAAASEHARRDEVNPDRIVERFEALVAATVAAVRAGRDSTRAGQDVERAGTGTVRARSGWRRPARC